MELHKVKIGNIDGNYIWLFTVDTPVEECVRRALNDLVNNHGFFDNNQIETNIPKDKIPDGIEDVYGILLMPDEEEESFPSLSSYISDRYQFDDENTYWISVTKYETGTIVVVP